MQYRGLRKSASIRAALMMCSLAFTLLLAGSWRAAAQAPGATSGQLAAPSGSMIRLADHTAPQVLDGRAMRVSHYDPNQMLRLVLAIRPPHMAEEEQFLAELQTKGSPNFHKFLSAEEWNARFGPSAEDEQSVVDWATSQGFTVTNRFANRLLVDVEAPAGVIEKALGVTINNYQVDDEVDFANDRDPLIPSNLTGVLSEIAGLNSIQRGRRALGNSATKKEPDYVAGPVYAETGSSRGDGDPAKATLTRAAVLSGVNPDNSAPTGPLAANGYIDPAELYSSQMYNYYALYGQGHCCNVHNDSTGSPADTSIALITYNDFNTSNVTTFFKTFGLAWNWTRYAIDGTNTPGTECGADTTGCTTPGYDGETDLDLSYSTATANSFGSSNDTAHVYVYEGVNELYSTMEDNFNFVLSDGHAKVVSSSWSWPESSFPTSAVTTLHGIFNSMVGQGITLIDDAGDHGATSACSNADEVMFPASDPDMIAAGGTTLAIDYNNGNYVSEVAWTGGTNASDCSSNGGGGGGGYSTLFSLPSWQKGLPGAGAWRMLPDFSLKAGGYGQAIYGASGEGGVDGTSIVAPELAGFFAQENAYLNYIGHICGSGGTSACEPIGNPNPVIYEEAEKSNAAHYPFYDITQGCNSNYYTMPPNTAKAFCAGPGYDQATGWGSANMLQLAWALNWEIIPASGEPYITWSGPAKNKWYNANQTVSWTIHDWEPAGSTPGSGIAGETQGWDSIPSDPAKEATPGAGNSFYSGPQFPNGATGCLAFEPNGCSGGVSQGCHTAYARGWNNQGWSTAGNSSYPESYGPICYDTVPPTITAVYNPPSPNAAGWYNGPVTITLTASDPGGSGASGVSHIFYSLNNTTCIPGSLATCSVYGSAITLSEQEVGTPTAFSEDKAGNFSSVVGQTIRIDSTPPATTAGFSGVLSSNAWTNSATITLKATDNLSGVASTYYTLDGGSKSTYARPFIVSTVGEHTLDYWSVDNAGNAEKTNIDTFQVASSTTATLIPSTNPSVYGQSVTLTATVAATDPGTPTGTATFMMGSTKLASAPLSGGMATFTTSTLPIGSDNLWFTFTSSTANYLNSTSGTVNQVVHEPTTTTLTSTLNPAAYGVPVTFTAKVKPSISGTPTGQFQFLDGAIVLATETANSSGQASLTTSALAAGSHSITAVYSGDTTYAASTSNAVSETISKAGSATALKTSTNSTAFEEIVNLTATVSSAGGTPTGTVTFLANNNSIGTAILADGVAILTTKSIPVGTNSITASYSGDPDFMSSASSAVSVVVGPSPTNTTIASSFNPSTVGASVTFTATVISAVGPATGTVTFKDGTTSLGSETLNGGKATFITANLTEGAHTITALYAGETDYASSASSDLTQTVNPVVVPARVIYIPDYYGGLLQVRVGKGAATISITIELPNCSPNSVAVNGNKAYVVCNADGDNPDKILVYNAATIRSASAGTLTISPLQTITSNEFNSLIGIAFDASNNLWVASYGNNQVDEITAAELAEATPAVTASLVDSPSSPVALAFDKNGSLWITGQYGGGILLNFASSQLGRGINANPDYCLATVDVGAGCQSVDGVFLNPEGLALFNGDVWVANNSTGADGNIPGRELVDVKYSGGSATAMGTLTVNATFGKSGVPADSPFVCPGGLFGGATHLWVNDESYGEANPQCGAAGDVASKTGGVFDFTPAQLAAQTTTVINVLGFPNITGRPGFGGLFVENDQ